DGVEDTRVAPHVTTEMRSEHRCTPSQAGVPSSFMMESTSGGDPALHPHGEVRAEVLDEHILVMTVDRAAKKNAFTPKITAELSDALTGLDEDPELFVGVLVFTGDHTTAGLEMPLFFSDEAKRDAARR